MSQPRTPPQRRSTSPDVAVSYPVAGMVLYGGLGWLVDRWVGTSFLAVTGIVVGGVLGLWLTVLRFTRTDRHQDG